jgi:hypothetical protein
LKEERDEIIKFATMTGRVTLLTRSFGRGTDFISRDDNVIAQGGVHVISTFLSEEVSEEVQIMGRTARQGQSGSFEILLLDSELEVFGIKIEDLKDFSKENVYENLLNPKRNKFFADKFMANKDGVKGNEEFHKLSMTFQKNIFKHNLQGVKAFLLANNKGPNIVQYSSNSTTIVAMDATGSMSSLIQKTKLTVATMYEGIYEILKARNITVDIELQFVAYRDYYSTEDDLLQISTFETKADNLRKFLDSVKAKNGSGDEAIEAALNYINNIHSNKIKSINQVILIGDAPATKTRQEVEKRRAAKGETYWKTTKYNQTPTFYKDELAKLKANNIKVNAFYVANGWEKSNFEEIAKETGGKSAYLDVNSSKGAELLCDFIIVEILRSVPQNSGTKINLIEDFNKRYGKSYA